MMLLNFYYVCVFFSCVQLIRSFSRLETYDQLFWWVLAILAPIINIFTASYAIVTLVVDLAQLIHRPVFWKK